MLSSGWRKNYEQDSAAEDSEEQAKTRTKNKDLECIWVSFDSYFIQTSNSFLFSLLLLMSTPFGRRDSMKPNVFSEHQHDTHDTQKEKKKTKNEKKSPSSKARAEPHQSVEGTFSLSISLTVRGVRGNEDEACSRVSCALSFFGNLFKSEN